MTSGKTSNPNYNSSAFPQGQNAIRTRNPTHLWLRPRWRARPHFCANSVPTFAPRGRTRIGPETRIGPGGVLPRWPRSGKIGVVAADFSLFSLFNQGEQTKEERKISFVFLLSLSRLSNFDFVFPLNLFRGFVDLQNKRVHCKVQRPGSQGCLISEVTASSGCLVTCLVFAFP